LPPSRWRSPLGGLQLPGLNERLATLIGSDELFDVLVGGKLERAKALVEQGDRGFVAVCYEELREWQVSGAESLWIVD
jgi:hypothetical protein